MSTPQYYLELGDATRNGVYLTSDDDFDTLAAVAAREQLHVTRCDLAGCRGKDALLQRLATALSFPDDFGFNWDALADSIGDLSWLPPGGQVLLFAHGHELREFAPDDFEVFLDILRVTCGIASDEHRPWFAFFAFAEG